MGRTGTASEFHKRVLSLLLIFIMALPHTGCGSLLTQVSPEQTDGNTTVSSAKVKKGKANRQEKKVIDYSTDRFNIGGINAFYILPGLENIPDAMAEFKVLDYTLHGDFVYYYVTPCYMAPEEFDKYNEESNKTGVVADRETVSVPEGRREDYEYDAAVLMTYNPGTGAYRILYARAYQIDKVNEFDPATEGRPYYYLSNAGTGEKNSYRTFIQQRILCCKVAGRDEYLLMEQDSLTGKVFDTEGNVIRTASYRIVLDNEVPDKKEELFELREDAEDRGSDDEFYALLQDDEEEEDPVDPDTMNVLITGAVMTEKYETYLGLSYFLGGDYFKAMPAVISSTCMIYKLPLNRDEGGTPLVSVNVNADLQEKKWKELDGRFFTSFKELEEAEGYSMEGIKTGKYGKDYMDFFSPFTKGEKDSEVSMLVGMPYFVEIPSAEIDGAYYQSVREAYDLKTPFPDMVSTYTSLYMWWISGGGIKYGNHDDWRAIKWGADNEGHAENIANGLLGDLAEENMTINEKRAIQAIAVDTLARRMNMDVSGNRSLENMMLYYAGLNFLPRPGAYMSEVSMNKAPSGFNEAGGDDPGILLRSDHILSVVSSNEGEETEGTGTAYLSPVDYFPESHETAYLNRGFYGEEVNADIVNSAADTPGLRMVPYETEAPLQRTVYVHDTKEADEQIKQMKTSANLSEDAQRAVDQLSMLIRTSPDIWEKVKLGWFISQVTGDMDAILNTVSQDAAKAKDEGKISEDDYKKAMELLDRIQNDMEQRDAYEVFQKAREDAKKELDEGKITQKEYEEIIETLNRAEQEKLGLNDEDWEMFEKLVSGSDLISNAQKSLVSSNGIGKKDTLQRISDLSKQIPEDIREGMLYLCAGFCVLKQQTKSYPLSYEIVFPPGATVDGGNGKDHETVGGSIDSHRDGVIVSAESEGEWFEGNTFMIGYRSVNDMDLFDRYTYGTPIDLSSMEFKDGDKVRSIVVMLTDEGAKFLERNGSGAESRRYSHGDLEDMLGDTNGDRIYESMGSKKKTTMKNVYTPLAFDQRGNEAYESVKAENELQDKVNEDDFKGFLTNRMLVTSTGYTRDTEQLLDSAIKSGLASATAGEGTTGNGGEDADAQTADMNDRYTGHLNSAKNICMIAMNKALICSVTGGTKILDLDHGTVADDMEGSYYRAYQRGNTGVFSLVGFSNTDYSYLDVDLPLAKIYTLNYENGELDRTVVEAFKNMLDQYAKDYLYREYRTVLTESGEIKTKETTEAEQKESIEAGAIFDPANTSYEQPLLELEKKYGIDRTPAEIRDYTEEIREKVAGVKPAITRLYELAGAKKLAADEAKRNEGYWKSVESRMTLAKDTDTLGDILVEIRMHDDVLPSLPPEQAAKYRTYKTILNLTKANTQVSANDIFRSSASMNSAEAAERRLRVTYRNDVLKDIINDYCVMAADKKVSGNEAELLESEKKEMYDIYISALLNQVNPENYETEKEAVADEFVNIINHGKAKLSGGDLDNMRDRVKEELPSVDAVWKLEELVMREKIENTGIYSEYRQWLAEYDERVSIADNEKANLKIPVKEAAKTGDAAKQPLSGNERISYLRTSPAYRAIIGDLKSDDIVKEFLYNRGMTWDDYCKDVVKKAGMRVVKDEETADEETAEEDTEGDQAAGQ